MGIGGNNLPTFEALLCAGADVNKGKNHVGSSLLELALFGREYGLAELFLKHGAIVTKSMLNKKSKEMPQALKDLLQQKYNEQNKQNEQQQEQQCCICFGPDGLADIPCQDNKHGAFLCGECCNKLAVCPLCRGVLIKFDK